MQVSRSAKLRSYRYPAATEQRPSALFVVSALPGRSRGHLLNLVVRQERLGGIQAGVVGRLEEHLRERVHPLRRAHHRRHQLPVGEEEPSHGRLHGVEGLEQLHLAGLLALAAPPAVVQPHGRILHLRAAVGVHLDAEHPEHSLLEVPGGVREVHRARGVRGRAAHGGRGRARPRRRRPARGGRGRPRPRPRWPEPRPPAAGAGGAGGRLRREPQGGVAAPESAGGGDGSLLRSVSVWRLSIPIRRIGFGT